MNTEEIGNWAGIVWNALSNGGAMTIKDIKKETKLREKDIFAGIGWLAREGKVEFVELPGVGEACRLV